MHCKFAEQCLGTLPEEFVAQRDDLFKDRVAVEMKKYFGTDFKRIGHASKVANYAEKIAKREKANLPVILCAAYLYDIGVKSAMEKYGSDDPEHIKMENPGVARQLMEKLGAKEELIKDVVTIVEHKHPEQNDENLNSKVVHDADMLAHMVACQGSEKIDENTFSQKLEKLFLTQAGHSLAKQVLLPAN